jgi:hypothetical protein
LINCQNENIGFLYHSVFSSGVGKKLKACHLYGGPSELACVRDALVPMRIEGRVTGDEWLGMQLVVNVTAWKSVGMAKCSAKTRQHE